MLAIGVDQEFQWAWDAARHDCTGGISWFSNYRSDRRITCYYAYIFDDWMGPVPQDHRVRAVRGEGLSVEWPKRQLAKAGVRFAALDNRFASCEDPVLLHRVYDRPGQGEVTGFFWRWSHQAALPFHPREPARRVCVRPGVPPVRGVRQPRSSIGSPPGGVLRGPDPRPLGTGPPRPGVLGVRPQSCAGRSAPDSGELAAPG
jgi:hypothetical protein